MGYLLAPAAWYSDQPHAARPPPARGGPEPGVRRHARRERLPRALRLRHPGRHARRPRRRRHHHGHQSRVGTPTTRPAAPAGSPSVSSSSPSGRRCARWSAPTCSAPYRRGILDVQGPDTFFGIVNPFKADHQLTFFLEMLAALCAGRRRTRLRFARSDQAPHRRAGRARHSVHPGGDAPRPAPGRREAAVRDRRWAVYSVRVAQRDADAELRRRCRASTRTPTAAIATLTPLPSLPPPSGLGRTIDCYPSPVTSPKPTGDYPHPVIVDETGLVAVCGETDFLIELELTKSRSRTRSRTTRSRSYGNRALAMRSSCSPFSRSQGGGYDWWELGRFRARTPRRTHFRSTSRSRSPCPPAAFAHRWSPVCRRSAAAALSAAT